MNFFKKLGQLAASAYDSVENEAEFRTKQLDQLRHKTFGTAEENSWEKKTVRAIDKISSYSLTGIADQGAGVAGDLFGKATNNPKLGAAAGLLIGAVIPGPGGKKPPRKTFTKAQRDLAVRTNNPPKRTDLTSNADFRGINGDVQANNTGLSIRMETRPEYKQNMTSTSQYGKGAPPQTSTTHHRMGIQDQQAFIADLTPAQLQQRREILAEGDLFMGNVGENYEPLYDGVMTKSGRKAGMNSPDHKDVHDLSDELRSRLGIKYNKKDRSLDTINGTLIKDLPPEVREGLQIQLGLQDELIINKVQNARYQKLMELFPELTHEQRREMILKNPQMFANLSTNVSK